MKERNKGRRLNDYLKDYVVFDLETTGINQNVDKIVEISAVKVCGHEIVGEYSTLVNPCMHIPAAATAVNGITDEMVADAPGIKEAVEGFVAFIGDSVLVGHNIHTFDTNFIYDAVWEEMGKELKIIILIPCIWQGGAFPCFPTTSLQMWLLTFRLKQRALTGRCLTAS